MTASIEAACVICSSKRSVSKTSQNVYQRFIISPSMLGRRRSCCGFVLRNDPRAIANACRNLASDLPASQFASGYFGDIFYQSTDHRAAVLAGLHYWTMVFWRGWCQHASGVAYYRLGSTQISLIRLDRMVCRIWSTFTIRDPRLAFLLSIAGYILIQVSWRVNVMHALRRRRYNRRQVHRNTLLKPAPSNGADD